jgi:hypothetical protein
MSAEEVRFDVFLSHNSKDKPLVKELAVWLKAQGIKVWYDEWELRPGMPWQRELEQGIVQSGTTIICFGQAGFGTWHEPEMRAAISESMQRGCPVIPVLLPGCPANLELPLFLQDRTWVDFRNGLDDEAARGKLLWGITGQKPETETQRLVLGKLHNVPDLPPNFLARPETLAAVKTLALNAKECAIGVTIAPKVGVHGMGGIGKTVLAAAFARDDDVRQRFPDGVFWITLGQTPHLVARQQQLAHALSGQKEAFTDEQEGQARLSELCANRACLVVVDDVWDMAHIAGFNVLGPRAQLLITTRNANLITGLNGEPFDVDLLSLEQARVLLANWARQPDLFQPDDGSTPLTMTADTGHPEQPALSVSKGSRRVTADAIINACGFLPLAIAMVGAMLRDQQSDADWDAVLALLREADLEAIEQVFPGYEHPNLFRALHVSVNALPPDIRDRYLDFAVFPEDTPVPVKVLETFWSATGVKKSHIRKIVTTLQDRSLLRRDDADRVTLHDLQYDYVRAQIGARLPELHQRVLEAYARTLTHPPAPSLLPEQKRGGDDSPPTPSLLLTQKRGGEIEQRTPSLPGREGAGGEFPPWPNGPNDGYFFEHLCYHLHAAGRTAELKDLLLDFQWLQTKLTICGAAALINDYRHLPDDQDVRLVEHAVQLSAHVLAYDPAQLPSQLHGRLCAQTAPDIKKLLARTHIQSLWLRPMTPGLTQVGGALLRTITGHTDEVTALAVTPDGRQVVSASDDETLRVWNLSSGEVRRTLIGHTGGVTAVAVTPNGRQVVAASRDRTLKVWNLCSGAEQRTLTGHTSPVTAVAVTPDGRQIVSASQDGTLKVWDLHSGEVLRTLTGHTGTVWAVAVTPNGRQVVSASHDRTLKVWDLHSGAE